MNQTAGYYIKADGIYVKCQVLDGMSVRVAANYSFEVIDALCNYCSK